MAHGGIIENTDLKQIPNAEPDAFTGATKISPTIGAHVKLPVLRNAIETGVDYMYANQTFTYNDNNNGFNGKRKLSTSQFMVPITLDFNLMKYKNPQGVATIKIGMVSEYNIVNVKDENILLPEYSLNHFSSGITMGVSSMPITLRNNSKLGFSFDLYRGGRIYTDFYNKKEFEMPASSFFKATIIYQFK
jgi:hypothetical protein